MLPTPKPDRKPPAWFKDGFNCRPVVRDEAFSELVSSIKEHGLIQPIGALEDGTRIFGNRRFAACVEAGFDLIPVSIYPTGTSPGVIAALGTIENLQRLDQTDYQTYVGLKHLKEVSPGIQNQEIAKMIGKSASMVTQYLSVDDLCDEAKAAFMDGKIGVTKAYKIAGSPDQQATLALFLNGGTRDEADRKTRAAKTEKTDTEQTERLPVALNTGIVIIKAKKDKDGKAKLNLTAAKVLLTDALAKVNDALNLGLSVKTAVHAWDETKHRTPKVRKPRKPRAAKESA